MRFEINIAKEYNNIYIVEVPIYDDFDELIINGKTSVSVTEENLFDIEGTQVFNTINDFINNYVESILLPDLRNNNKSLKTLKLPKAITNLRLPIDDI